MDIYQRRSRWKLYLGIAGLIIAIITMIYSNFLAKKLAEVEENNVYMFGQAIKEISGEDDINKDIGLALDLLERLNSIPVILEREDGTLEGYNFRNEEFTDDQAYLEKEKIAILNKGFDPIKGSGGYAAKLYYKHSQLYTLITYFPLVQIMLLGSFVLIGYFGLNASKRAEQNRVWAGMAKETAHQLGTPISAILAWVEILRDKAQTEDDMEIVQELSKDIQRLELVADRFSKIGSTPSLEDTNMNEEVEKCIEYMKRRAPKNVHMIFEPAEESLHVNMNRHLFDWVVENIIRNALDAMDGSGSIEANVYEDMNYIALDLKDSGDGIPSNKFKTVFEPGYSTKKRGWGLGLSLAKRIIEEYHKGKIFIKKSVINEGTTFTIKLPKV